MNPSGIGGGSVWREEIARGISNASLVLCILTEDYSQSEWCLKELALAKQIGIPILAISTRQIIPFEPAIVAIEKENQKNVLYSYDEVSYTKQFRLLLDGVRDVIEKRRVEIIRRNMQQRNSSVSLSTTTCRRSTGLGGSLFTRHLIGNMGLETNGQFDPDTLRCLNTREREALTFGGSSGIDEGSIGAGNRSDRAFNDVTTRNNGPLLDNDDPTGPQLGSSRGDEAIRAENKT